MEARYISFTKGILIIIFITNWTTYNWNRRYSKSKKNFPINHILRIRITFTKSTFTNRNRHYLGSQASVKESNTISWLRDQKNNLPAFTRLVFNIPGIFEVVDISANTRNESRLIENTVFHPHTTPHHNRNGVPYC